MRYSSPSNLISFPPYWPKITVSPTDTFTGVESPDSETLPGPTATTSPCDGFSLAEPERIMPPDDVSSSSLDIMVTFLTVNTCIAIAHLLVELNYSGLVPSSF